jgi:hypothetical protein
VNFPTKWFIVLAPLGSVTHVGSCTKALSKVLKAAFKSKYLAVSLMSLLALLSESQRFSSLTIICLGSCRPCVESVLVSNMCIGDPLHLSILAVSQRSLRCPRHHSKWKIPWCPRSYEFWMCLDSYWVVLITPDQSCITCLEAHAFLYLHLGARRTQGLQHEQ